MSAPLAMLVKSDALITMTLICPGDKLFYSAVHYSAKRGLAIACRLSVVCQSVTLVDQDHIG